MKNQRRDFLKVAATISSGVILTSLSNNLIGCNAAPKTDTDSATNADSTSNAVPKTAAANKDFGLQLYTLRDDMPKDPKGILKQVAGFGYKQIESYEGDKGMFWGMKNTEFKQYMDELGMTIVSSHCDIDKDFERKANEAAAIGMKYLICPYIGKQKNMDEYKKVAEKFNSRGEICKKAGLRFAYHNHEYSFIPDNNLMPQDVMMQNTDKNLVDYELDLYWVVTAGQDPITWINKYPDRFRLYHIKDRIKDAPDNEREASTNVGAGKINFAEIIKVAEQNAGNYYIVEQERYDNTTPLDAAKDDAAYMKKLLG